MVTREKDLISFKELSSLIVIMIGTKATDMTATLLFDRSLNAAWIVCILSFLIVLPSLLVLNYLLKKFESKNFLEITRCLIGKKLTFIIGFLFFLFALLKMAIDTRSYTDQLITVNLPKTPLFILYILLLLVCLWGAKKGWEAIASIAIMLLPYILIALTLLYLLLFKEIHFNRIFPLFGFGFKNITENSFHFSSMYADAFLIAMMYPFVKNHKTYTRGLIGSLTFTVLLVALLLLLYNLVFDYRSIDKITYPFNEAIRFVSIGKTITNIETFFLTFWLLGIFVKFTIYLYLVCKIFGFVFSIEEFEHTLLPITILVLVIGMVPENDISNIYSVRTIVSSFFEYGLLYLPFFLLIVYKVKEVRSR
ncbi:hypothetical protein CHH83_13525 [Bacillus sp. 7586-K]|uniref:Spore germination protein (Amino acid permease) n=1 Tax=Metabacillus niabensis TaxID=324854 RepID=A0ABT9Z5F0_9BACI|nr:endospore germination permease [Metabacillus niabensis]MDQ0227483.1 spore germination protein (amino acid permease) [Metabacillus niabensis]PAD68483.1 hypothetical protein CHH83_13525 [Bacillus sp. 7586-K]